MERGGQPPPSVVVLRPLGSGLALSLGGLAIASLLMAGYDLGWVPARDAGQVGVLLLVTVVPLQALGTVFAILARDGAVGGSLALQAATWAATGAILLAVTPGTTSSGVGLVQLAGGTLIATSGLTTARSKLVPGAAVGLSGVHFVLSGVVELGASATWQDVSGALSLVVVALAGYGSWAAELEDSSERPRALLGRRGRAQAAVSQPFDRQVADLAHEAGVRREL
jgi:hypothetical protein